MTTRLSSRVSPTPSPPPIPMPRRRNDEILVVASCRSPSLHWLRCGRYWLAIVVALVIGVIAGCGSSDSESEKTAGTAGASCYPNGTCNSGLSCRSNVCAADEDAKDDEDGGMSGGKADGQSCTVKTPVCDPDCQARCDSVNCVDLCCPEKTTTGVLCDGQCKPVGTAKCGGKCNDFQSDDNNCGSCGKACTGDLVCTAGKCGPKPE